MIGMWELGKRLSDTARYGEWDSGVLDQAIAHPAVDHFMAGILRQAKERKDKSENRYDAITHIVVEINKYDELQAKGVH